MSMLISFHVTPPILMLSTQIHSNIARYFRSNLSNPLNNCPREDCFTIVVIDNVFYHPPSHPVLVYDLSADKAQQSK